MQKILLGAEPWVTGFFRITTAVFLFSLMILTCVDVLGRYFFNRPVYGGLELTEILLAGTIFFALPIVSYRGDNVVVDLIRLPSRRWRIIQHVLTNLIGAGVALGLSQQLWLRAGRFAKAGETTIQIKIPLDFVAYGISVLLAVAAVGFVLRAGTLQAGNVHEVFES